MPTLRYATANDSIETVVHRRVGSAHAVVPMRTATSQVTPNVRIAGFQSADPQASTISTECVISTVAASMIDAEQYFSCDSFTARSTAAGFKFFPVTTK